jgi:hypothetical protein
LSERQKMIDWLDDKQFSFQNFWSFLHFMRKFGISERSNAIE